MIKKIYQCLQGGVVVATFCIEQDASDYCKNNPGTTYKIIEFQSTEYSL